MGFPGRSYLRYSFETAFFGNFVQSRQISVIPKLESKEHFGGIPPVVATM